jgi:hypothetical protein
MSTQKPFTYQPEDLERLLRTKEFNGLLPEERAFVLQHVSNEKEFNELKMLLGNIESSDHEMQDPPAAVWKNLKKEFNAHKPSLFKVWLNFLFPPLPKWSGFRTVSFSLVGMAAVVGAIVWFVPSEKKSDQFASVQDNSKNNENQNSTLDTVSENSEFKVNPEQYAELKPVSGIYVTPVVREVEEIYETRMMDEVQDENTIAPANDAIEAKSDRRMENDSPASIESTNASPASVSTFNLSPDINLTAPNVTFTSNGTTNVIATDSVKFQPKKKNKKKTPPKKK